MRGTIDRLSSPHPLGKTLPALYQEDEFAQRYLEGFDECLAPIFTTLDNFDCYLDPWIAPEDFVEWLAGWVGLELDENWPLERRRALVAQASELYRKRGTLRGLSAHIALVTGVVPEIADSGGVRWSCLPESELPGSSDLRFKVQLRVEDASSIDVRVVEAVVSAAKPAHLIADVEVIES